MVVLLRRASAQSICLIVISSLIVKPPLLYQFKATIPELDWRCGRALLSCLLWSKKVHRVQKSRAHLWPSAI
jgi:hypothetical protein